MAALEPAGFDALFQREWCAPCLLDRRVHVTATHLYGSGDPLTDDAALPLCPDCADTANSAALQCGIPRTAVVMAEAPG